MFKQYAVRFRRKNCIVPAAEWTDWLTPVMALGPFAAAKAVSLEEDWSDLPVDLIVEVFEPKRKTTFEYHLTVSLMSERIVLPSVRIR